MKRNMNEFLYYFQYYIEEWQRLDRLQSRLYSWQMIRDWRLSNRKHRLTQWFERKVKEWGL